MARIPLPTERVVQGNANIAADIAAAPGRAIAASGRQVEALSNQFFEQAKAASQAATFNRAMSAATEEFATRSNERYQQVTDEDGNPTFETLPKDIGTIADEVKQNALNRIGDFEVAQKFIQQFDKFGVNQQISAMSKARTQQIDFSRASLNEALTSYQNQAVQVNPDQLGEYENQAKSALDEALNSGFISAVEHGKLVREFQSTVRVESYRNLIKANPAATLQELSAADPDALGLTKREQERLINEAEAEVRDIQVLSNRAKREQEKAEQQHRERVKSRLELGMATGEVGESEILQTLDTLGEIETNKLLIKLINKRKSSDKAAAVASDISEDIATGAPLVGTYTSAQIEDHYQSTLSTLRNPETGEMPSLSEKAEVAVSYRSPIKSIQKELGHAAQFGEPEMVQEAIEAYEFMKNKNPESVRTGAAGYTKADVAALEAITDGVENTPIPLEEIIEDVRDRVYKRTNPERSERAAEFQKLKRANQEFDKKSVSKFIKDVFDDTVISAFGTSFDLPGGEPSLSSAFTPRVQQMLEEAYIDTGKPANARRLVASQLRDIAGVSQVNSLNRAMFNPPEKVFPQFTSEQLEHNLRELVAEVKGPSFDAASLEIQSFSGTRGLFNNAGQEIIQYMVYGRDEFGQQVPLEDNDGNTVKWVIDPAEVVEGLSKAQQDRLEGNVEELKKKREGIVEGAEGLEEKLNKQFKGTGGLL